MRLLRKGGEGSNIWGKQPAQRFLVTTSQKTKARGKAGSCPDKQIYVQTQALSRWACWHTDQALGPVVDMSL